jgi:hypothetical protein
MMSSSSCNPRAPSLLSFTPLLTPLATPYLHVSITAFLDSSRRLADRQHDWFQRHPMLFLANSSQRFSLMTNTLVRSLVTLTGTPMTFIHGDD